MREGATSSGGLPGYAVSEALADGAVGVGLVALAETCDDPLLAIDFDGRYMLSNAAHATGLLNAAPREVLGRSIGEFYGSGFAEAARGAVRDAHAAGARLYEQMVDGRFARIEVWPLRAGGRPLGVLGRARLACPVSEGRRRAGGGAWRPTAPVEQATVAIPGALRGLSRDGLELLRLAGSGLRDDELMPALGWSVAHLDAERARVAEHLRLPAPHWVRVEGYERGLHLFGQGYWERVATPACTGAE